MFLIAIFFIFLGFGPAIGSYSVQQEWQAYKENYDRKYKSLFEEMYRKSIFQANLNKIHLHNRQYELGLQSYEKGINEFTDRTESELDNMVSCIDKTSIPMEQSNSLAEPLIELSEEELPKEIDYRKLGAVTSVKFQGSCGSCWAFSAIGALESHHFLLTKKLEALSAQNLIDCTPKARGCKGGAMSYAFNYIEKNNGIASEKTYPYKARDGFPCSYNDSMKAAAVSSFVWLPSLNETKMQIAVAQHGPLAVPIYTSYDFFGYCSGIFYSTDCQKSPNHGVVIVGYGTDNKTGLDYWIVKNSWGKHFGENGYVRMSRNRDNNCNIAFRPSYPVMEKI